MQRLVTRPFELWLNKHSDFKRRHIGPERLPELGGQRYECDHWYFVIEDHDDGKTPAMAIKVGHEERSDYMGVEVENYQESGEVEASCFLGLFTSILDLDLLLKVLTKVNR